MRTMSEVLDEYEQLFGREGDAMKAFAGEQASPTMRGTPDDYMRLYAEVNEIGRRDARPRERPPKLNTASVFAKWNRREPARAPRVIDRSAVWDRWNRRETREA